MKTAVSEAEIRAAFAPAQASLLLRLVPGLLPAETHLSARQAAERVGWSYDVFRREEAFDAANVAPQNRHKRYRLSTLLRVAENLRKSR